jgi:hypothetical protein
MPGSPMVRSRRRRIDPEIVLFGSIRSITAALADDDYEDLYGEEPKAARPATGSPGERGPLEARAEAVNPKRPVRTCRKNAGSGEPLQLLKDRQVGAVIVHAPADQNKTVAEGWATRRSRIGSCDTASSTPKAARPGFAAPRPPPRRLRRGPSQRGRRAGAISDGF